MELMQYLVIVGFILGIISWNLKSLIGRIIFSTLYSVSMYTWTQYIASDVGLSGDNGIYNFPITILLLLSSLWLVFGKESKFGVSENKPQTKYGKDDGDGFSRFLD